MSDKTLYTRLAMPMLMVSLTMACGPNGTAPSTTPTTTPAAVPAGTFAGRALQAGTSNPIVSAAVTMFQADAPLTTTTDASGAFSFTGLSAGASMLQVSASGFVASTSTVTVPQTGYVVILAPVGPPTPPTLVSVAVTGNAVLTSAGQNESADRGDCAERWRSDRCDARRDLDLERSKSGGSVVLGACHRPCHRADDDHRHVSRRLWHADSRGEHPIVCRL